MGGNKFGRGNPHAAAVARLRSALLKTVKPAGIRSITAALLDRARKGDTAAAKLVDEHTVGRPAPTLGGENGDVPLIKVLGASAEVWNAVYLGVLTPPLFRFWADSGLLAGRVRTWAYRAGRRDRGAYGRRPAPLAEPYPSVLYTKRGEGYDSSDGARRCRRAPAVGEMPEYCSAGTREPVGIATLRDRAPQWP